MSTSNSKYVAPAVRNNRRGRHMTGRPEAFTWLIGAMLVAVPLPAFAESSSGQNIAIALSSNIVGNRADEGVASGVVAGAIVEFSVSVTGPAEAGLPATSFAITDKIPEDLSLFVGDLEYKGSGPAAFKDNDSGLQFRFGGLSSPDDSIEFSSDGGKTFGYAPIADSDGFDPNVTHIRLRPEGSLLATSGQYERFSLRYRMKVK